MDLQLNEVKHPDNSAQAAYDGLVAIDDQKKRVARDAGLFFSTRRNLKAGRRSTMVAVSNFLRKSPRVPR